MSKLTINPKAHIPTQGQYQWYCCLQAAYLFLLHRGDIFSPFTAEGLEEFARREGLEGSSSVHSSSLDELVEAGFFLFEVGDGFGYRVLKKFVDMIATQNAA